MRVLASVIVAVLLLAAGSGTAHAQGVEHRRIVRSVAGPEAVAEVVRMLCEVELGAQATTITLDVEGVAHEVRLDYAALEQDLGGREGSSLVPLAMIGLAVGAITRGARLLARLGRHVR